MNDRVCVDVEIIALVLFFIGRMYEAIKFSGEPAKEAASESLIHYG